MNAEQERLIDELFYAFAWRKRPARIFDPNVVVDGEYIGWDLERAGFDDYLRGISPRELTFDALDAYPGDDSILLSTALLEGAAYYLPSVVALCVEDADRADFMGDVMMWRFRCAVISCAYNELLSWPIELRHCKHERMRRDESTAKEWFLDASTSRNRMVAALTMRERHAIAECFDYSARTYWSRFPSIELLEHRAAAAFLRGRPYAARLGARNAVENQALLDSLEVLKQRLPAAFGGWRTRAVEAMLRASLKGWGG